MKRRRGSSFRMSRLIGGLLALALLVLVVSAGVIMSHVKQEGLDALAQGRAMVLQLPQEKIEVSLPPAGPDETTGESKALIPPPGEGLKEAPAPALTENTESGPLPRKGEDGAAPWQYYARPAENPQSPAVAVVVIGLGFGKQATDAALQLAPEVSLAFSPYAPDVAVWAASARALGHEILVDLPVEPTGYPMSADPGPYALLSANGDSENERRLRLSLVRFQGYVGTVSTGNTRFFDSPDTAYPTVKFLGRRGLLHVAASQIPEEQLKKTYNSSGAPFVVAELALEGELTREEVANRLSEFESVARRQGGVLVVSGSLPATLEAVADWIKGIKDRGLNLIPVSALARMRVS